MYKCKFPFSFFPLSLLFYFIVDTVDESPFVVTFIKKKSVSVSSESCQVSSSFSYLATCFYTAYCSTSVSNTSLKVLIKTFRKTVVVQVHQKQTRAQKRVFFNLISYYYVICFQTKYCEIK